ncbi:conjugal transfer protein [Paraconexibacter antarcticus]|uniref:Conjugal transfer protein n=1 Tax=Paraconexibacter antarcticus TaxID=2949664 RepID=A0ABY5DZW4_9ACTN|nr:conjugal transfer protein [Paraconexibacter antarcticus]UTI66135.1 conjugal transfer protein [Paraconexibacter antarcticus]
MDALPQIPLRVVRASGRAPRVALLAACAVLTVGGALRLVSPPAARTIRTVAVGPRGYVAQEGLAQRFAMAYLTLQPGREDVRNRRLAALGFADPQVAEDRAGRVIRRVVSTVVLAAVPEGGGVVRVTVGIDDGQDWTYLAVPVRSASGRLSVPTSPAVVGPPPVESDPLAPSEDEVQDSGLKQVATRVVGHYLAGDRSDLEADLVAGASPALPAAGWRLATVDAVTWVVPSRRVAAVVETTGPAGLRLTFRYELAVVRRGGRWLVSAVFTTPNPKEQTR